jgi:hypothetical protein
MIINTKYCDKKKEKNYFCFYLFQNTYLRNGSRRKSSLRINVRFSWLLSWLLLISGMVDDILITDTSFVYIFYVAEKEKRTENGFV